MAAPRYKPVAPGQVVRDLRKEFKRLETKQEPGPERAAMLASFTRAAHTERQLNMAMHTAQLCIDEDPDAPALLIDAYIPPELADTEARLRAYVDLRDIGRYVSNDAITSHVDAHVHDEAVTWIDTASGGERKRRLRVLESMFNVAFADAIRDELEIY